MDSRPLPSLNLPLSSTMRVISTLPSQQHRPSSHSPIRYSQLPTNAPEDMDEKSAPLTDTSPHSGQRLPPQFSRSNGSYMRDPAQRTRSSQSYTRPRGLRIVNLIRPWIPIILYGITSLAFLIAIALYRTELFTGLDELSQWLLRDEDYGLAVLFFLIFLTTIPPIPLYSTLIVLSGYTFGPWLGAAISYMAALAGALCVFTVSRALFRNSITRWLDSSPKLKRVIRAIEKRPKLLFLIRLAPYPYNVMNCVLAASPTLSLRTYTTCTAVSLFKVIIHTSLGASIHSFRDYHVDSSKSDGGSEAENSADTVARIWTVAGVGLCIGILVYLAIVARRAVDEELDDERVRDSEERVGFLAAESESEERMVELA